MPIGGTFDEIAQPNGSAPKAACHNVRSSSSVSSTGRPSRSVGNINPIWSYADVPFGTSATRPRSSSTRSSGSRPGSASHRRHRQPEHRDCGPTNPDYIGGDILGGANDRLQVVFRPRVADRSLFHRRARGLLCSQSTPPGTSIHGLCGYHAAESALRRLRRRSVAPIDVT